MNFGNLMLNCIYLSNYLCFLDKWYLLGVGAGKCINSSETHNNHLVSYYFLIYFTHWGIETLKLAQCHTICKWWNQHFHPGLTGSKMCLSPDCTMWPSYGFWPCTMTLTNYWSVRDSKNSTALENMLAPCPCSSNYFWD